MKEILVVDDIKVNRYLLEVLLKGSGYSVSSAANGLEALEMGRRSPPHLIVADILMPVMDGYALCREWKKDPLLGSIPFIFYTATYTEPQDQEFALSLGAERFVIKPQEPEELVRIIAEVLEHCSAPALQENIVPTEKSDEEFLQDYNKTLFRKLEKKMTEVEDLNRSLAGEISERKRYEEIVSRWEVKFQDFLDAASLAILWADIQGRVLYVNRGFVNLTGYALEDLSSVENWFAAAYPDVLVRKAMMQAWNRARDVAGDESNPVETRILCKDGALRHVSVAAAVIGDIHLTMFRDVTEQVSLESQLLQAQKMEVVGHLAGGLAHDFNNILMAIVGYGHLLMTRLPPGGPSRRYMDQILSVTDRGAKLTQSIFAFSRKQKMEVKPVKLNRVVTGAKGLLLRLINESIELKIDLCSDDMTLMADPGQLEQILMNLVTNARDAVDGSGSITIGTGKALPDDAFIKDLGLDADAGFALLTVADTGHGMDEETKKRVFEPFFTTKEKGKGTGLGLSVACGIVRRHNGHIRIESEPGKGTRFRIYLPTLNLHRVHEETTQKPGIRGGNETILLAEDNEFSLQATSLNLREMGYTVVEAPDGEQAVGILETHRNNIPLVVLDLMMPKLNGWEVYREAVRINPDVKVIFISGYTDDTPLTRTIRDNKLEFLSKPVSPALLLAKVREVLDEESC